MSAASPMNVGEKEARNWAAEQELTPTAMVNQIAMMRDLHRKATEKQRLAHAEWQRAADASDQLRDRIEALKFRLVSEL